MNLKNINVEKYFKKYSYDINKIVGIDPFDFNNKFLLENGILSKVDDKDIKKEYLISSYIPNKYVISYEFSIAKNLLEKIDLDDYVETKCYEDVGLDDSEEYVFKYKIDDYDSESKEILIEVFIVSHKELNEFFNPVVSKYNYLDYVTYPGFVFNVLYKEKILEPHNDLFIYFSKYNVYITLYSEGEFLQTSIIPEGLESMFETLISSIKIKNFDFDVFLKVLITKGLDISNYSQPEQVLFNELSELISNKFLIISNQLHSITRKFSLTTIDRVFMSTVKGIMPGSSEFANMYLGVKANDLKFDTPYNPENIEIDQLLFLTMLYTKYEYENDQKDNFTLYHRPPTFFYRKSGQLISISIASLILSILYPMYQLGYKYILDNDNVVLQQKAHYLESKKNKLNQLNNQLNNQFKSLKKQKNSILTRIDNTKTIIQNIYIEKENYIPKSIFLANLSTYLYKNKVYLKDIKYGFNIENEQNSKKQKKQKKIVKKKVIIFDVYAQEAKFITNFINDIVQNEHLIVSTLGYKRDSDVYIAQIIIKVEK